jgi:hypothetical protein
MNIFFPVTPEKMSARLKEVIFQSSEYVFDPCASGPKHYKILSPSKGIYFDCWLVSTDIGLECPSSVDSAICIVNWEGLEKPVHDFINYLTQHFSQKAPSPKIAD